MLAHVDADVEERKASAINRFKAQESQMSTLKGRQPESQCCKSSCSALGLVDFTVSKADLEEPKEGI